MNTTKYLQTDSRWSGLGYPRNPCTIGNSGCGEVAIVNAIIEMQKYAKYTPATIVGYARQYAAPNCDGTYWSGIPMIMKNYGLTEVKEHATMPELFKELAKGERVAIYLMGSRKGGSLGVHWSSSGHFICSTSYRYRNGEHEVYVKDSYSNSSLRNGWLGYSTHLKGDVLKVWSGKLTGKLYDGSTAEEVKGTNKLDLDNSKLTVDGIGGKATVKAMQKFFGTTQDGIISGQNRNLARYYPSLQSVQYGSGGSECIKKLQAWCGLSNPDGIIGMNTTKGWQKKLIALGYLAKSEPIDGIFGVKSMKAMQECLNNNGKNKGATATTKPSTTSTYKGKLPTVAELKSASNNAIRLSVIQWAKKIADGKQYKYKEYGSDARTHQCPICHNLKGKYKGWNCIGYDFASWKHGGDIPCKCSCDVLYNGLCDKFIGMSDAEVLSTLKKRIGINDIKLIRNGNKPIPAASLWASDLLIFYSNKTYQHMGIYVGNGKISDATSSKGITYGSSYASINKRMPCLFAIRFAGGNDYVKKGDRGSAIYKIKDFLTWYNPKWKFDDNEIFGAGTDKAVRTFQKEQGLKVDGIVSKSTIDAMKKVKK